MYKATADLTEGRKMYDHYSAVTDNEEPHFLSLRSTVLARKQPRKVFVQCNTIVNGKYSLNMLRSTHLNTHNCYVGSGKNKEL